MTAEAIKNAKTPEQHQAIADAYAKEAENLWAMANAHHHMDTWYAEPGYKSAKLGFPRHCRALVQNPEAAAKEFFDATANAAGSWRAMTSAGGRPSCTRRVGVLRAPPTSSERTAVQTTFALADARRGLPPELTACRRATPRRHARDRIVMTRQGVSYGAEHERILATVARLATAANGDTLYRDVYLRRAAEILAPIITEKRYESALTSRQQVERLRAQARAAISRQDWEQVRELGTRSADLQRALGTDQVALAAAESVYGAPPVAPDPLSPGLIRFSGGWSDQAQARAETSKALAELARDDAANGALYSARQAALDAIPLAGAAASASGTQAVSAGNVEQQALKALESGDDAALRRLADAMLGKRSAAAAGERGPAVARAAITAPAVLGEPLPEACVARAQAFGLERAETAPVSPEVAAAIGDFLQRYAVGASAATRDRASEGVARLTLAVEGINIIPPDLAATFAETISLFALHLFVNSAGLRYVPLPTQREVVLVEAHAEGDEAETPLLRELGCGRRRALSRDDIEVTLLKHGARIVGEHLGLDPLAFRLVCIPADLFIRLGRDRGWGNRQEWTHFDGYQIAAGGRLRALVGANARFGGLADLCSISRGDARENTVVRFAVIRRERLGVRIG